MFRNSWTISQNGVGCLKTGTAHQSVREPTRFSGLDEVGTCSDNFQIEIKE